jgi:vancomycin resistance protein YoaR
MVSVGVGSKSGRTYTVDSHPDKEKIIKALCKGNQTFRNIAKQFNINHVAIMRYVQGKFYPTVAREEAKRDERMSKDIMARLEAVMHRMQKLYDACDAYLTDPANPEKYNLDPRSWEMDVVYTAEEDGLMVKRKATLQSILDNMAGKGYQACEIVIKTTDPRKLIIDTAKAITPQLELMAKIEGLVKEQVTSVTVNQYWIDLKAVILKATEKNPEVRERIVRELEKGME